MPAKLSGQSRPPTFNAREVLSPYTHTRAYTYTHTNSSNFRNFMQNSWENTDEDHFKWIHSKLGGFRLIWSIWHIIIYNVPKVKAKKH